MLCKTERTGKIASLAFASVVWMRSCVIRSVTMFRSNAHLKHQPRKQTTHACISDEQSKQVPKYCKLCGKRTRPYLWVELRPSFPRRWPWRMLRVCSHPSSRCGASTGGATKPNEKMPGKVPITPIVPPILKFRLPTVLITGDLLLLCTTDPTGGLQEQAGRGNVKRSRTDAAAFLTACITPCTGLSTITRVAPRLQPPSLSAGVSTGA